MIVYCVYGVCSKHMYQTQYGKEIAKQGEALENGNGDEKEEEERITRDQAYQ